MIVGFRSLTMGYTGVAGVAARSNSEALAGKARRIEGGDANTNSAHRR
jgi:hypothetical protein